MAHKFEKSIYFNKTPDKVFRYHVCMDNIKQILPEHVKLNFLEVPCNVKKGDILRMKISLYSIPFFWETEITEYRPDEIFVDLLKKGPFSSWRHQHLFKPCNSGTIMTDIIDYDLPFCALGRFANYVFVRKELEKIFEARHQSAAKYLK